MAPSRKKLKAGPASDHSELDLLVIQIDGVPVGDHVLVVAGCVKGNLGIRQLVRRRVAVYSPTAKFVDDSMNLVGIEIRQDLIDDEAGIAEITELLVAIIRTIPAKISEPRRMHA